MFLFTVSEPQIKRHPNNITMLVDSKAVLPCVTLGYPKPDITWIKDEDLVKVQGNSSEAVLAFFAKYTSSARSVLVVLQYPCAIDYLCVCVCVPVSVCACVCVCLCVCV